MEVDYVRVYECSINPATGQGCATIGDNPDRPAGIEPPPLPGENSLAGNGPVFMLFDDVLDIFSSMLAPFGRYVSCGALVLDFFHLYYNLYVYL